MEKVKYDTNNQVTMLRDGDTSKYYDDKGNVRAYVKDGRINFHTGLNMFSMRLNDKIPGMIYSQDRVEQNNIERWIEDKVKEITKDASLNN